MRETTPRDSLTFLRQVCSSLHSVLHHPYRSKSRSAQASALHCRSLHPGVGYPDGTALLDLRTRTRMARPGFTAVQAQQASCYLSSRLSVFLFSIEYESLRYLIFPCLADVIADSILIFAPLKLLKGLSDPILRRRLIVIFSTCIVTTIVSLVHAAYIITDGGVKVLIAALVEVNEPYLSPNPEHVS